jgi:hypothetical protein
MVEMELDALLGEESVVGEEEEQEEVERKAREGEVIVEDEVAFEFLKVWDHLDL